MKNALCMILLLFTLSEAAFADTFKAEGFVLDVPKGYMGPLKEEVSDESLRLATYAFVKEEEQGRMASLLQVVIHDNDKPLPAMSPEERLEMTTYYLAQWVLSIARARTAFSTSDPMLVRIGDIEGVKTIWQGDFQGYAMKGVLYAVIKDSKVYIVRVEGDAASYESVTLSTAEAVENMRFE